MFFSKSGQSDEDSFGRSLPANATHNDHITENEYKRRHNEGTNTDQHTTQAQHTTNLS